MTREEIVSALAELGARMKSLTTTDRKVIREIADSTPEVAGMVRLDGRCPNCWTDAVIVFRNFYGVSESGGAISQGNDVEPKKWRYLRKYAMNWRGIVIDSQTADEVIDEFVKFHPQFFELNENMTV